MGCASCTWSKFSESAGKTTYYYGEGSSRTDAKRDAVGRSVTHTAATGLQPVEMSSLVGSRRATTQVPILLLFHRLSELFPNATVGRLRARPDNAIARTS